MKPTDPRIIDATTSARRERCVIASILDSPGSKPWGPNICTALAYAPNFWDDGVAGKVAAAIGQCVHCGRPVTLPSVSEYLSRVDRVWLTNPSFNEALPLDLAEIEAMDLVRRYHGKRLAAALGKAWSDVKAHPERSREIGRQLKVTLEEFV